jgi:hypothetical protein
VAYKGAARRLFFILLALLILTLLSCVVQAASLSPSTLSLLPGTTGVINVSNIKSTLSLRIEKPEIASATYANARISVSAKTAGETKL